MNSSIGAFLLRAGRLPIAVFLIHCVLSLGFNAYDRISWLDVIMHLAGGIAIASFFNHAVDYLNESVSFGIKSSAARVAMIFGLVAVSTVFWEFAEFLADTFFNAGAQRSIANIMKDQFFGLLGGGMYLTINFWRRGITLD